MEIEFFGGNCFKIKTKKTNIVVDDNLKSLGGKSVSSKDDVALFSFFSKEHSSDARLTLDDPGEYEVADTSIVGIGARAHMDTAGQKTAVIFKLIVDDLHLAITGHIYPDLNDQQLETIGHVDILIIPVGGNGYTLDPEGALDLIKKLEPKIVIPSQYKVKGLNYEVPAVELSEALHKLGMEAKEPISKLKIKPNDVPDELTLQVLEVQ